MNFPTEFGYYLIKINDPRNSKRIEKTKNVRRKNLINVKDVLFNKIKNRK